MGASNRTTEGVRVDQTMTNNFPSPRELMRSRHPDLFSDSVVEERPSLARPVFEYHLETLTARKEEYQFEHFCRLIAEKEICPNLRVQTGPTGGGDSKVDSETYPVAKEISNRWWLGEPSGGSERWAFAFSAKRAWKPKLEADVDNILSTQRDYKRIYFFTNQFVSDKSRASVEDALTKKAGIPVHIVDRSWLVDRVYSHGHLQIAISALQIDDAAAERKARLGPKDTERQADLDELDAQIAAEDSSPQGFAKRGEGPPPKELFDTSQRKHTERRVLSPINVPIWNQAGWGGTLYGWSGSAPPFMGLMFQNMEAASRIFAEWSARFGQADKDDDLRIAIITGISKANPTHYAVIVGPNIDRIEKTLGTSKTFVLVSRVNRMSPETNKNLDAFLKEFDKYGAFYLMPVKLPDKPGEVPDVEYRQYLLKGHIHVRPAWQIGEHDYDMVALDVDEDPVIPDGITDAPVLKAMARKRDRSGK